MKDKTSCGCESDLNGAQGDPGEKIKGTEGPSPLKLFFRNQNVQ